MKTNHYGVGLADWSIYRQVVKARHGGFKTKRGESIDFSGVAVAKFVIAHSLAHPTAKVKLFNKVDV